jgi:hypothetical protein
MRAGVRDEIENIKDERRHRRLRFNVALVAEFLGLGAVPAEIVDVSGLCDRFHVKRDIVEGWVAAGLPCSDVSLHAVQARKAEGLPR